MFRFDSLCPWVVLSVMVLASSAHAVNQFNEAGTGDLAHGANWSEGAPPLPGAIGTFTGTGDATTFLSSDLSTGQWQFNRPFGQFNIDLQGHTLTSDRWTHLPVPTGTTDPFIAGLNLRDGTVESNLLLESGSPNRFTPPHTVTSSISNVTWTGQEWRLNGKPAINEPGFEESGKVSVTIDQGSKVTLDELWVNENGSVNVTGPGTELAFEKAFVLPLFPQGGGGSVSLSSIAFSYRNLATLRAENGATIQTRQTDPPISNPVSALSIAPNGISAIIRRLELDGPGTRMIAPDANIFAIELNISDGASLETNHLIYSMGEVNISNATASFDLRSVFDGSTTGVFLSLTELQHAVGLNNATLNGNVTGFRYVDLDNGILNGNVQGVEAIRGEGVINGDLRLPGFSLGTIPPGFLPTGLIDLNGDLFRGVYMQALLTGPPDANTPRVEVETIDHLPTLDWLLNSDEPFGFEIDFDELFHASVGDRFELLKTISTALNPGIVAPGDLSTLPREVRTILEERLAGIRFLSKPAGYDFDVFIEPHAIGFTVVAVPELSSLAMLTLTVALIAILQVRRLRGRGKFAST